MKIGILVIELYLSQSGSLKQKRFILQKIKDRLRNKFNISIAEVDFQDKWQRSVIGISCIYNNEKMINSTFDRIIDLLEKAKDGYEILKKDVEII